MSFGVHTTHSWIWTSEDSMINAVHIITQWASSIGGRTLESNGMLLCVDCPCKSNLRSRPEGVADFLVSKSTEGRKERKTSQSKSGRTHLGKVTCPERQASPHKPRGKASKKAYSSNLAPKMEPMFVTQLSGRPCPASSKHTPEP
eukprot:1138832-Pelagomonas_calceolata.AAC.1